MLIPVLNEAAYLLRVLEAVLAQDYPHMEVLVIDGGSSDGTCAIVEALQARDDRLRLLHNPGRIQSRALNIGLRASQGEVIVRVDGHSIIAPDYVRRCVEYLREGKAEVVGGVQRVVGDTPLECAVSAAYRSPFGVPSRYRVGTRPGYVDTVYLGAWTRSVLDQVGYFDETLVANEDYELNYRIRRAGGRVYLALDIHVEYFGRQSLAALWRQYMVYGRWKLVMLSKHPASLRLRQTVAPAFVATLTISAVLSLVWVPARWVLGAVVASYVLANLAATVIEVRRSPCRGVIPWLPGVFACMHLAWGCGFWREALRVLWQRVMRRGPRGDSFNVR